MDIGISLRLGGTTIGSPLRHIFRSIVSDETLYSLKWEVVDLQNKIRGYFGSSINGLSLLVVLITCPKDIYNLGSITNSILEEVST